MHCNGQHTKANKSNPTYWYQILFFMQMNWRQPYPPWANRHCSECSWSPHKNSLKHSLPPTCWLLTWPYSTKVLTFTKSTLCRTTLMTQTTTLLSMFQHPSPPLPPQKPIACKCQHTWIFEQSMAPHYLVEWGLQLVIAYKLWGSVSSRYIIYLVNSLFLSSFSSSMMVK